MDKILFIIQNEKHLPYSGEVKQINNLDEAKSYYQDGIAYTIFEQAYKEFPQSYYILSFWSLNELFNAILQIKHLDIQYIVPLTSNFFGSIILEDHTTYPALLYWINAYEPMNEQILISGAHAKDFYEPEQYMKHINKEIVLIHHKVATKNHPSISYVANHLAESPYSTIEVVCHLSKAAPCHYPDPISKTPIFLLHSTDFVYPVIYFSSHTLIATTIDNLFTFGKGIESNLVILRLIEILRQELNITQYEGYRFVPIVIQNIKALLVKYLDSKLSIYYEAYTVQNPIINRSHTGVSIEIPIDIVPFFTNNPFHFSVQMEGY